MKEPTDKQIVAAAKAIDPPAFSHPHPTWTPSIDLILRWKRDAMERAYAVLKAAAIEGARQ